jgi:hypothetical protein
MTYHLPIFKLTDEEFEDMLKCFDPKDIPEDRLEARIRLEMFVGLVSLVMRPLPGERAPDGTLLRPPENEKPEGK